MRDLEELTHRFTDAFNRDDLDAVMALMADDAIYDQLDGTVSRGRAAIRAAFVPQFRGDFGTIRFLTEECFIDEPAGKSLIRWQCTLANARGVRAWRGLDVLHFANGLVREKHTYCKAVVPLLVAQ
jgi:ketosteroid isomerase-like protein